MKKEDDKITDLFRSHLENAELTPKENFWDCIHDDLLITQNKRHRIMLYRISAAACIIALIGIASINFYHFTPANKANLISSKIKTSGKPNNNISEIKDNKLAKVSEINPNIAKKHQLASITHKRNNKKIRDTKNNDDSVTIKVNMSIRYFDNEIYAKNNNDKQNTILQSNLTKNDNNIIAQANESNDTENKEIKCLSKKSWAIKAALNLGIPSDSEYDSPFGCSVTLERQLNNWLALESGLQYSNVHSTNETLHYLGIPVKLNISAVQSKKIKVYTTVGGVADKCISDGGGDSEPIQLTFQTGLGLSYHLSKSASVYIEPTYLHYFNNHSHYSSYRSERNNSFNIQCGLCMTY